MRYPGKEMCAVRSGDACEYREVHANAGNCVTTLRTNTVKIQGWH